jgi:hypothetical protein
LIRSALAISSGDAGIEGDQGSGMSKSRIDDWGQTYLFRYSDCAVAWPLAL